MKKEELRIGNICYYKVEDSLDERKEWSERNIIDALDLVAISQCEVAKTKSNYTPIPLTEDWFKQFGFKDFKSDYGIMLNTPDRHLVIMPIRNEFYPVIEIEAEFSSGEKQVSHLNKIQYVHELQNLYYTLTNDELVLAATPK